MAWSSSALAADELPHSRVELTTDRTLPGCSDAFEFKAILANWVPVSTIDPTAARALVVRIRRLPDGGKSVDTTITDENGVAVSTDHRDYSPQTDCFKVLYWTAFDAATRIRAAAPKKEEQAPTPSVEPPPSPKTAPCPRFPTCPPPSKPPAAAPAPVARRVFLALGGIASYGLIPDWAPGLRVAGGVQLPQLSLELDARWGANLNTRPLGFTEAEMHTFALTAGACVKRPPLLGCLLAAGGAVGAATLNRAYAGHIVRAFFGVGARSGVELPFTEHLAARVDVEVAFPLVGTRLDLVNPSFWETLTPTFTGGGSLVYAF
ncbi:hypothetical protein [Polyangium jinanense]|uniref:Uncharacterized protein n=1 Tax=Polyangium jinanense TaxID=2829994 RepID=A0A9X4AVQ9_9BACT|nr:hypothetical protein [Polyangium jinanense]MDC3960728.1 hypothetical protein [Polyangium jinanense]MDC3984545.1 hypothetical protein [Polyangium jinanense]